MPRTHEALEDERIIEAFWNRDPNAIKHAATKYGSYLWTVCYRLLGNRQDSDECENDIYLRAWNAIPPARPGNLKAFLAKLARASAVDVLRARTRKKRIRGGLLESLDELSELLEDGAPTPAEEAQTQELAAILNRFLQQLPAQTRVCFVKRYYFGTSVREIASETGIPKSSVQDLLTKTKNQLRETLEKEGYFP